MNFLLPPISPFAAIIFIIIIILFSAVWGLQTRNGDSQQSSWLISIIKMKKKKSKIPKLSSLVNINYKNEEKEKEKKEKEKKLGPQTKMVK